MNPEKTAVQCRRWVCGAVCVVLVVGHSFPIVVTPPNHLCSPQEGAGLFCLDALASLIIQDLNPESKQTNYFPGATKSPLQSKGRGRIFFWVPLQKSILIQNCVICFPLNFLGAIIQG